MNSLIWCFKIVNSNIGADPMAHLQLSAGRLDENKRLIRPAGEVLRPAAQTCGVAQNGSEWPQATRPPAT